MKKLLITVSLLLLTQIFFNNSKVNAQYVPVITNELGDTIPYVWPIPDSLICIKDEIIIKFKKNALNVGVLCYTYQGPPRIEDLYENWYEEQKNVIMTHHYSLDTLISDSTLKAVLESLGGIYLTRISCANPCSDTLSITRFGDTIEVENYLWMKLKLNNDTSAKVSCFTLTYLFQNYLEEAEPIFCGHFDAKPLDTFYDHQDSSQFSLWPFWSDAETAWNYQKGGSFDIKIGIIDNGIDFAHCDLGHDYGVNKKIYGGWNYADTIKGYDFFSGSIHGTPIAGIIGALTNGGGCAQPGVAGIAGGWYSDSNLGCQLYSLKIDVDSNDLISIDKVIGAIRDATSYYHEEGYKPIHDSYGVHIINCSWAYEDTVAYIPNLQRAFNYAFEHGVSIVASRGNEDNMKRQYPSCFDPSWITSVGGHDAGNPPDDPPWRSESRYGIYMDLLAPSTDQEIITTKYLGGYTRFSHTSAAAAHVSGALGLLRSEFLKNPYPGNPGNVKIEPEDYENMLKAAALDLNYDPDNQNIDERTYVGYDNVSGWGQLKIGKIFQMLAEGYVIKHYTISTDKPSTYPDEDYYLEVIKEGKRNDCQPGQYNVRRRPITGSINIGNDWLIDSTHSLYVWGRNGRTNKGGFSAGNPLFLTSYTEVTNGERDNGVIPNIPGIFHNNSSIVNAKTYQYELRDINTKERIKDLPSNDNLELYITVFGIPKPTSVNDISDNNKLFILSPNPVNESISIHYIINQECTPIIKIYNYLGILVYNENLNFLSPGKNNKIINTSNFSSGLYHIELNEGNMIMIDKFIVIK